MNTITGTKELTVRIRQPIPAAAAVPACPQGECRTPQPDPAASLIIGTSQYPADDEALIGMVSRCLCSVPIINDAHYGWLHQCMAATAEVLCDVRNAL